MNDDDKARIMNEARVNLAAKDQPLVSPPVDPLTRWRDEAAKLEEKYKQGALELREEEARRLRETQQCSPEAWSAWFISELRQHLHAHLKPSFEGIAQGVGELYSELRHRADAQAETIKEQGKTIQGLQLELAQLAIKLAELKTDQVMSQMPTSGTLRGTVN
jgi:hypothetical protein